MPKRNYIKELWLNRPWRYIPAVVRDVRHFKLKCGHTTAYWLPTAMYLNWQQAVKRIPKLCQGCLCVTCERAICRRKSCSDCSKSWGTYHMRMQTVGCGKFHRVREEVMDDGNYRSG